MDCALQGLDFAFRYIGYVLITSTDAGEHQNYLCQYPDKMSIQFK